jgi:hypothetical protein
MYISTKLKSKTIKFTDALQRFKVNKVQPRTQALSTTRLAGGKTLVQAGHVSPRFWEITKFLHKGGGLSYILPI